MSAGSGPDAGPGQMPATRWFVGMTCFDGMPMYVSVEVNRHEQQTREACAWLDDHVPLEDGCDRRVFGLVEAALSAGDLDANAYQHKPYLDAQVKDRG